ncbi:TonB-dependent receptor plug domain-containing protein [Pontibacter mangrovi]|uniref:TonB-dependent receptor plug domain-containing protein n=1 Tax=Pontibacter mangrovi TaxID=2589816 RepID=UPI0015E2C8DB|nr:TonB-dependent receptor plug domain-containing protein [Pontibacter mangrovi]
MKQALPSLKRLPRRFILVALSLYTLPTAAQTVKQDTVQTGFARLPAAAVTEPATVLHPDSLHAGLVTYTEQLLKGQIAGLRVRDASGAPGAEVLMKLRSGTSFYGGDAPLVVLDGVPLDDNKLWDSWLTTQQQETGNSYQSRLSYINPADVASVTYLKDAALNAVYGSRAANGVLYIRTKQAERTAGTKITYSVTGAFSQLRKKADQVLSAAEFRELIQEKFPEQEEALGNYDTDWQDVIYRNAFSQNHHLSASGNLFKTVPYYVSLNYLNQNGIIKTSGQKRTSGLVSLNPSLLHDHLNLQLSYRKAAEKINVINEGAISAAWLFDPTQPVHQKNKYGNYFTYLDESGNYLYPEVRNPLSLLEQSQDYEENSTDLLQAALQYKLHFYPALSLHARYASFKQTADFTSVRLNDMDLYEYYGSITNLYKTDISWKQKQVYVAFDKALKPLQTQLNLSAGLTRKERENDLLVEGPIFGNERLPLQTSKSILKYNLSHEALFGMAALQVRGRYSLNAALTNEKASTFLIRDEKTTTVGLGASWNVAEEPFLKDISTLSQLRLFSNYNDIRKPELSSYISSKEPIKQERTKKWNAGISWELLNERVSASFSYYSTSTDDLYLKWPTASGTGNRYIFVNGGEYKSNGVEASVNAILLNKSSFTWQLGGNVTTLRSEVVSLNPSIALDKLIYTDDKYGLALETGKPANTFYLYQVVYDEKGLPTSELKKNQFGHEAKYGMHSAEPKLVWAVHSQINYQKWHAGFLVRGEAGQYVWNYMVGRTSNPVLYNAPSVVLTNTTRNYRENGYQYINSHSDHYLEKASFARMEYLSLGYDVGSIWKERAKLSLSAFVQNTLVLTKYSGQDPEVENGIDFNHYPQPRTFSVGLKLEI